jgi:PAS domain S-box-containing protein
MSSFAPLPTSLPATFLPALLELLPNGVVFYTPAYDATGGVVDFHFAYLNPSAQRMLKLPAEPTASYLQVWPGSVASGAFAFHRDTFLNSQPAQLDEFYHADGYDICIRAHARRAEGGLLVSFTDASGLPLTAVEEALHQRQALHDVFEQTPGIIALLRAPNHRYEYVNPAYQTFFPGRQLVGLDLAVAAPELVEQGFGALLDKVYQTGETFFGQELPFTPPPLEGQPARPCYFNFTYQAYREASAIAGVSIFAYDVTEQVLTRQQREAERRQLQAVFAQAPVAVCVFQGEAYVLDVVNPLMGEMLGRPVSALVGRPFFEALPELRDQGLPGLLAGVRRTGIPFVAQEQEIQLAHHPPGSPGYYNFVYQPLHINGDQLSGIVCVAIDVTEQVRARRQVQELNGELAIINKELQVINEELGDSNQQLVRTNVDLDNFIYTASHDLKAPISNIEGLLYLLQEELPAEVAQDAKVSPTLTRMLDAVDRFKRTIAHLTDVSKLQKENAPASALVNLAAVIEDVRQDLLPLLEAAGANLFIDVAATPPVRFSEKNLRSVVYNLLSNALKYRSPARTPHVDVRAHVRDGHTVLEVHDNGLGLDPAHLSRLFTMFQRFHDHVEGTGIGLYMVKRMVENAGGRIEVHSQLGAGTTFFVYLPHPAGPAA